MPLQQHTPPDGVNNIGSGPLADCLAVAAVTPQHAGASPHPPLDSTSCVTSKRTPHAGALPRPPQYSSPRTISKVTVGVVSKDAPLPRVSIKQPSHRRSFDFASLFYPRI